MKKFQSAGNIIWIINWKYLRKKRKKMVRQAFNIIVKEAGTAGVIIAYELCKYGKSVR